VVFFALHLGHRSSVDFDFLSPLITLKALSYFDDVPTLPAEVLARLTVEAVDLGSLPTLTAHAKRPDEEGRAP
jgi:hypothetical protein